MALDEPIKQKLINAAIDALRCGGEVNSDVQTDPHGFHYVTVRAFATDVSVDMKINISPCLVKQFGLKD